MRTSEKKAKTGLKTVYMRPTNRNILRLGTLLNLLLVLAVLALVGLVQVNRSDEVGTVGVVGQMAETMKLSCGGRYDPDAPVLFHPVLPCGTLVKVHAANGQDALATVAHREVMFAKRYDRVADISPAVARALGLGEDALHSVSLRPLTGAAPGLMQRVPMVLAFQKEARPVRPMPYTADEIHHLTINVLSEAEEVGKPGYVAVTQCTDNRVKVRYRGQTTMKGVIYDDSQYSWTIPKYRVKYSGPDTKVWAVAQQVVRDTLTDRISGNLLGAQYMVSDCLSYFQTKYIKNPDWGNVDLKTLTNKEFKLIELPNVVEVRLAGRFMAPVPGKTYAKRLEMASR